MMDRARKRFASNVELLTKFNPELAVMGDRDWTNACENQYIQYMAKKLWLFDFSEDEVKQVNKAVTGYLSVLALRAQARPVQSGGRIVKGEIFSVRRACEHDGCDRHWKMNVRDHTEKYAIYTPIPQEVLDATLDPQDLVGRTVSFYAYLTASQRDPSFGFAHRPKLMMIEEK